MKREPVLGEVYNILAIPVAAGVLYPSLGIELGPPALPMSVSSIIVVTNAVLLKRVEGEPVAIGAMPETFLDRLGTASPHCACKA